MNTERILPKIIVCELKRQIDSQAVKIGHTRTGYERSRWEQALFHRNWQIENEHFVILVSEVFKSWKNWREIRNFDSKNFRQESWSKIILKMSNLYAVDNYFTFPVNQRYFLFLVKKEDCWAATKIFSQIYGIRMVYRETFVQIHKRLIRQLIQECSIPWIDFSISGNILVQANTERPVIESGDRDYNQSWAKMAQIPNSFSIFIFWFLKRPSTGILTLFHEECVGRIKESRGLRFQRNAEGK